MNSIKKTFRKWAAYFVTTYANRTFRKAIRVADSWQGGTHKRHYVITDPEDDRKLVTIDTKGFLEMRHALGIRSKDMPVVHLKQTCWYYTPDNNGRDVIPARELVIRRLAFVRDRLKAAGLLDEKEA